MNVRYRLQVYEYGRLTSSSSSSSLSLSLSLSLPPFSTLMRRVPDPESPRWNHMALLLHPGGASSPGVWMEDYKFLAAYKLKASVSSEQYSLASHSPVGLTHYYNRKSLKLVQIRVLRMSLRISSV